MSTGGEKHNNRDSLKTLLHLGLASLLGAPLWVAATLVETPAIWLTALSLGLAIICLVLTGLYVQQMRAPRLNLSNAKASEFFQVSSPGQAVSRELTSSDLFVSFSTRFNGPIVSGKI